MVNTAQCGRGNMTERLAFDVDVGIIDLRMDAYVCYCDMDIRGRIHLNLRQNRGQLKLLFCVAPKLPLHISP